MGDGQPRLLDQVRDRIRRKHYSIRTHQAYGDWIRRVVLHHNERRPRDMGAAEVVRASQRHGGIDDPLLYGTGMGITECVRLRVKDVEFGGLKSTLEHCC